MLYVYHIYTCTCMHIYTCTYIALGRRAAHRLPVQAGRDLPIAHITKCLMPNNNDDIDNNDNNYCHYYY